MEYTKVDTKPELVNNFFRKIDAIQGNGTFDPSMNTYIAKDYNRSIVGMITISEDGFVYEVGVLRDYRRKGVATNLFKYAAEDLTCSSFKLNCDPNNEVAIKYYKNNGWKELYKPLYGFKIDCDKLTE